MSEDITAQNITAIKESPWHAIIGVDPGKVGGYFPPPLEYTGGGGSPPSNGVLRSPYIHLLVIIVYYLICVISVTLN